MQIVFEDGETDEMVWVQLINYLHKPRKSLQDARAARIAKNKRRLDRAQQDEAKLAHLRAKRARYGQHKKAKVELARKMPSENKELLEKVIEKNKAKRARKKERNRLEKVAMMAI